MIKTKYGNAKLNETGHYRITSCKEGNHGKYLHRLIWEEHYGEIPKGYVIHHKDKNPQNNCILNLQLMTKEEHISLHTQGENNPMYGKVFSPEHRKKLSENHADTSGENNPMYGKKPSIPTRLRISKTMNKSGILNVSKKKNKSCKKGWCWQYRYYEGKKRKTLMSTDLLKLKKKVLSKGMDWIELDMEEKNEVYN